MELIRIDGESAILSKEVALQIADFERIAKDIEERQKALKKAILAEMEAKGIIKIETEELLINYIAPTDRESFDSKRFRSDHPQLYDDYVSMSPVKASVRVKVKKG